jgi:hypothetical protein
VSEAMNQWTFASTVQYLAKDPFCFEFAPSSEIVASIASNGDGTLALTLTTPLELSVFDDTAAQAMADRIVDRLSFELDLAFSRAQLVSSLTKDGRATGSISSGGCGARQVPSHQALSDLVASGWGCESVADAASNHLYREALNAADGMAQFLLLWNLLVLREGGAPGAARGTSR